MSVNYITPLIPVKKEQNEHKNLNFVFSFSFFESEQF